MEFQIFMEDFGMEMEQFILDKFHMETYKDKVNLLIKLKVLFIKVSK